MYASDGTDLAVHDLGGSGDDLLLVHGTGLCAQMLSPMADALGGDHRAAGLDLRGHGSSGRPPDRDYAWPRIGRDVREILDPRDSSRIEEMAQRTEGRRAAFASRAEIEGHFSSRGIFATFDPAALAGYIDGGFRLQPDGTFVLALAPEDKAAIYRGSTAPGVWDGLDILPDLDLDIAVLYGSASTGSKVAGAARLAKRDPRVRVFEVAGVGHFGPFEAPVMVGEMVSSIFRTSPRGLEAIRPPLPRRRTCVMHVVKTAVIRAPRKIIPVHRRPCE
jgi:pimeloyl-ACP methyl ester carboxylesterase